VNLAERHFALRGWVLAIALALLLAARARLGADEAPLRPAWLLLALAGILLRGQAGAYLGAHGNASKAQAPALAAGGPYRFSRNPLYVSNLLVAAGLIFYANAFSRPVAIAFLLALFLHHALLVRHEEGVLAKRFGEAYDAYRRDVPRWIGFRHGKAKGTMRGASLRETGVRQARNVLYALLATLSIWIAAR